MTNTIDQDLIVNFDEADFLKFAESEQLFLFAGQEDLIAIAHGCFEYLMQASAQLQREQQASVQGEIIGYVPNTFPNDDPEIAGMIYKKDDGKSFAVFTTPPKPQTVKDALEQAANIVVEQRGKDGIAIANKILALIQTEKG